MIVIEIYDILKPWTAAFVPRKGKAFSYHRKFVPIVQWQMKPQFNRKPFTCPLFIKMQFYHKPPESTSKVRRKEMLDGKLHKLTTPDLTNLTKFFEDCGNNLLWEDDKLIVRNDTSKMFGERDKAVITIFTENF